MENINKISYKEFEEKMWEYGKTHNNNENYEDAIHGVIVFKASNWPDHDFSERSRSYEVSSCNRCFQSGKIANSMFGNCLDGTDQGVRLDWYNWEVDYCYML